MWRLSLFLLILLSPLKNIAQETISGHVYDYEKKTAPLEGVVVKNLKTGKKLQTPASGRFTIAAAKGDLLEFSKFGYHSDTLFLTNLADRRIYLPVRANELNEVNILGAKVNSAVYYKDPEAKEFKRFETDDLRGKKNNDRAGGLKFNLGYGKYRSQLNKRKQLEEKEGYEEEINSNFNERIISSLIKLQGEELKTFIYLYKPAALLVSAERPFNYNGYIVKAYNTWLKLKPEERKMPPMPKL
ncbi:MAG: hypothetical protein WKF66_04625 [Pedobacter sp.]